MIVAFIALAGCVVWTFVNFRETLKSDRILLYAAALSLPFLFVRDLYGILQAYQVNISLFNSISGSVVVYACMAILVVWLNIYVQDTHI